MADHKAWNVLLAPSLNAPEKFGVSNTKCYKIITMFDYLITSNRLFIYMVKKKKERKKINEPYKQTRRPNTFFNVLLLDPQCI